MALSWNEIKDRAIRFSKEWESESSERAEARTFWDQFFDVFGISRRKIGSFEKQVQRLDEIISGDTIFKPYIWGNNPLKVSQSVGK